MVAAMDKDKNLARRMGVSGRLGGCIILFLFYSGYKSKYSKQKYLFLNLWSYIAKFRSIMASTTFI